MNAARPMPDVAPSRQIRSMHRCRGGDGADRRPRLREQVRQTLRKRGLVLGLSGGIDSSVCGGARGARRRGARTCSACSCRKTIPTPKACGSAAGRRTFGIEASVEDIGPTLDAMGCYQRRDEFIRQIGSGVRPGLGLQDRDRQRAGERRLQHLVSRRAVARRRDARSCACRPPSISASSPPPT